MFHLPLSRRFFCWGLLLSLGCTPWAAPLRAQTPAVSEPTEAIPVTQREVLLNELPIVLAPRPGSTSVSIIVLVKIGSTFDLAGKAGLAALTAEGLLAGTKNRDGSITSVAGIREELQEMGGQLEITTDWDSVRIQLTGPNRNALDLLTFAGQFATSPAFLEEDFNRIREARIAAVSQSTAREQADLLFTRTLFGSHPYHHSIAGTPESLRSITRFAALDFYKKHFVSNNAAVVVAGDLTMPQMLSTVRRSFGGWVKGKPAPYSFLPPVEVQATKIVFYPDPAQTNLQIRAGMHSGSLLAEDALTWKLTEKLLKQCLPADDVAVDLRHMADSPWMIRATATPATLSQVLETRLKELDTCRQPPAAEKLQAAKDALLSEYKNQNQTTAGMARVLADMERYKIGRRSYLERPQQIAALTGAGLQPTLEKLGSKKLLIVVQGGKPELETILAKFGTVEVIKPAEPAK
ncbi:MAG: insulinase family protein [Blastocatellia bacterium]|nr:insulinase family protein [Blastocatellia bacterium]